jgi:oxygen-independent coproporphyrinogen-3 oxidase
VRHECNNKKEMNNYIVRICTQIKKECNDKQFKTIYIGGGTPNFLSYENLEILLKECKRTLENSGEFTIECNPEFINQKQIDIFRKYSINRISLGVQSTNDKILKTYNRHYTISIVKDKIKLLYKNKISNISCDFIYGFNELTNKDLYKTFNFIVQNKIKHVSFYSLEIKDQSILKKNNYKLDDDKINEQFVLINKQMENKNYKRYEVSNFALSKKYESQHNKAY